MKTTHVRRGDIDNRFCYLVDFVLIDPGSATAPKLFSLNRFNILSFYERDHGSLSHDVKGKIWAEGVLNDTGIKSESYDKILLLTQPRFFGYVFNPVSFWFAVKEKQLLAVIAEVNNTFGDRHSYVCKLKNNDPIDKNERMISQKAFHVSPFQDVGGDYEFAFDFSSKKISIRIIYKNQGDGVVATITGHRQELTNLSILSMLIRRPFNAIKTITLIHWQALKLVLKGASYRSRPTPPDNEVSL